MILEKILLKIILILYISLNNLQSNLLFLKIFAVKKLEF